MSKGLTHKPFQALRGRVVAQIIRLPVPFREDDEDGPPVEGAPGVLIAVPFGADRKRSRRKQKRAGWSSAEIEQVRREEERRGVRR